jgi:hypothetical protein
MKHQPALSQLVLSLGTHSIAAHEAGDFAFRVGTTSVEFFESSDLPPYGADATECLGTLERYR